MAFHDEAHGIGFSDSEHSSKPLSLEINQSSWVAEAKEDMPKATTELQEAAVASAQARARIVLEKFQRQRSILKDPSKNVAHSIVLGVENERRQRWLAREKKRIQAALLSNLGRLVERDKVNLVRLDSQVSNAVDLEHAAESHYAALLERRRQKLLGAAVPARNVRKKQRPQQTKDSQTPSSSNDGAALYISGLKESDNEDMLRALFGAFGTIKRIHFYRNKAKNALKGDGLVIFDVPAFQRPHVLLENVCGQLNGSELPQGNILKVEASRTNKFVEQNEKTEHEPVPIEDATGETKPVAESVTIPESEPQPEEDSELDDFFDSI